MIFENSFGTILTWTVEDINGPLHLALASVKKLKLLKPDLTEVVKDLSFVSGGDDGKVKYLTEEGVIDQPGLYEWQLQFVLEGWSEHTEKGNFMVGSVLFTEEPP